MNEITTGGFRTKTGGYTSTKLWAKRERRQSEAFTRQSKYNLTPSTEKIKLIASRRGKSKRELERLAQKRKKS